MLINGSMCTMSISSFKVVQRHYSGEVENVYVILQPIYSGSSVPDFVSIAQVL